MKSKRGTGNEDFYLSVLSQLKLTTNLGKIREKLDMSKQQLNYYLRRLSKAGLVVNKSRGLWEVVKNSKNSTKYGSVLPKDFIRGHGYVVEIIPKKFPKNWESRIEILDKLKINYKLVGALKTTPRIKVLGRKVWLCNNKIRIFDKKDESYYGENAIESRKEAFWKFYKILDCLENKLGFNLRPYEFNWKKEHYALIKNDLAIDQNQEGVVWRIKDKEGEWLLIDDSLEMGGELENTGKKALETNIKMQKWWNQKKENDFKIDDDYIKNNISEVKNTLKELSQQNIDLSMVLSQVTNNLITVSKEVVELKSR